MITSAIQTLATRTNLEEYDAVESFTEIINGTATEAQTAAFLTALAMKGETPQELNYFLQVLEKNLQKVEPNLSGNLLYVSGAGGDILNTFHISTTAAFVAAGAGCNVAKYVTSHAGGVGGSAELLKNLGGNINVSLSSMKSVIEETGIGFLFVPIHVQQLGDINYKIKIGLRNALTLLSALVSPIVAKRRILGTYSAESARLLAETLQLKDMDHVMTVHGLAGLDSLSNLGKTRIFEFEGVSGIDEKSVVPEHYGFDQASVTDLMAGTSEENAIITKAILEGASGPKSDIVLMNAGAMIYVCGMAADIKEGVQKAKEAISAGAALEKLNQFTAATKKYGG